MFTDSFRICFELVGTSCVQCITEYYEQDL